MRATVIGLLVVLLGTATVVQAEDSATDSARSILLGKPVVVRDPDADLEPPLPQPKPLPTLGKPIVGRTKAEEPREESAPPAVAPQPESGEPQLLPVPSGTPRRRQPSAVVDRRPDPSSGDVQVQPASFLLPAPAAAAIPALSAAPTAETKLPLLPPPPPPEAELLPMPRQQPTATPPGGVVIGPDLIGPLPPGHEVAYSNSWWDRLKCKLHRGGGWVPARTHGGAEYCDTGCTLCPDLCCTDPCCGPNQSRVYGQAEYLYWQIRSLNVPPLVTTTNDPVNEIGAIGQPGTRILYGGEIDYGHLSGARLTLGVWLDHCHGLALEGSYFRLEDGSDFFVARSDDEGNPLLARPFFDQFDNQENVELVSDPGVLAGAVSVDVQTRLWGAQLNLRSPCIVSQPWGSWCKDVDLLGGVRYVNLEDQIAIRENLITLVDVGETPAGTNFRILDLFQTKNEFYGGQIGFDMRLRRGAWSIGVREVIALGVTQQEVGISGFTIEDQPEPPPTRRAGGLLTQVTNIGSYSRSQFSIVNELGVTLGYQATCCTRLFVGYQGLYWTNVARADQQIDRVVNRQLLGGGTGEGTRPRFVFRERDFWAHGLTVGVEITY
jgi:hypothetical protein